MHHYLVLNVSDAVFYSLQHIIFLLSVSFKFYVTRKRFMERLQQYERASNNIILFRELAK